MFTLFVLVVAFLFQIPGFPTGYYETTIKPRDDMRDLGAINMKYLVAEQGVYVEHCTPANITQYVVWLLPINREPMYRVEFNSGWTMVEIDRLPEVEC